ncbi:MAG TPA: hypothetical protein VMV92_23885 [Streptosporangiaceae bacterium]|nr:hypothetical protein [Streptosporangiaceae bacterium]HVB41443.1 hypothetical protein [Streptosporangiaceae bacterium]
MTRRKLRRWVGTVSVSAGTAVFSGAVAILVDSVVQGGTLHWPYLAGSTALGAALSGGGAWLLATVRSAVGIGLAAMDHAGDVERYQDEADSFARFGHGIFTAQTSVQVTVETPADLKFLRARLRAALRTLHEIEQRARQTGLLFQGRPEVGFHVGRWLNQAGGRIDLYSDARHGGPETHFAAIRLTPAISAAPRHLDRAVYRLTETGFSEAQPTAWADLPRLLSEHTDTCMGLAINLNGPVDEAGFVGPVLASATQEGATVAVFLALPAPADDLDAPGRQLASSREEYESTVAAILAAARHMRAAPGLVYLKTPAVIPVALGRYLYGKDWIPMRHHRDDPRHPVKYDRFADTSNR